jgi:hypothetical protein
MQAKSLILSAFFASTINSSADYLKSPQPILERVARDLAHATSGVAASASTLDEAKMLVFLSRCSNPKAVFAIPAGTERHRHSLRLGGQHGEEAKDEDEVSGEKGRAQDKAPEEEVGIATSSLRLRLTSLTASNGPARSRRAVSASRRASTPPVPVRREGVGETGLELHRTWQCHMVRTGCKDLAPRQRQRKLRLVSCPGLLADALSAGGVR